MLAAPLALLLGCTGEPASLLPGTALFAEVSLSAELPAARGGDEVQLRSERASWSDAEARFEGSVELRWGELVLECDELSARFEQGRWSWAEARGHLRLRLDERRATAGRAVFHVDEGRLELLDGPVVEDGSRRLSGARISLYPDSGRVECEDCELVLGAREPPTSHEP